MTERLPDDAARQAFWARRAAPVGAGCPPAERLWDAVHGYLAPGETEAVVEHTAACAACAEAWRLALELRREHEAPALGRVEWAPPRASSTPAWHRWAPLALAAGLLLAIGLVFRPGVPAPAPGYREPASETVRSLVAEARPLDRERFLLRWSGGPRGARYNLLVSREDLVEVARARGLAEPRFLVPPAALAGLPSGTRLLWQVEVVSPTGERRPSPTFFARLE